tara:strand:- start:2546 stop:3487 length:942 start_codon:yes stop_codon:yes gene_type:complete
MSFTNFPNGLTSFGMPVVGGFGRPQTGNMYWVDKDHDNASDGNTGLEKDTPLSTVQAGVDKCVSGNHDVVFVTTASTAYAENVTVTSKDYVSIVGLGLGEWGRPDIHPSSGIALAISLSQGFHSESVYYLSDDDDAVTCDSEGWLFSNCKFQGNSDGLLLKGYATDDSYSAGQGMAYQCGFESNGAAGVKIEHAETSSGIGSWGNRFIDCYFRDNTGADFLSAVGSTGGGAGIFTRLLIQGCQFLDDGASHVYMDMDQGVAGDLAANSALICGNYFADDAVIAAQCAIGSQAKVFFVGNYDAAGLINGSSFNN